MNIKTKLSNVRLSFNSIYNAESKFDGDPKFHASFIIDPSSDEGKSNLKRIKDAIRTLEKERLAGKELPIDKLPLRDGSEKSEIAGWDKMIILSSANKKRPVVVNGKREPVAEGDANAPYSGCYVNAIVTLWAMDHQSFGQRIIASLEGIQFAKDGESFASAASDVTNDFDELDVEEVSSSSVFDL